VNYPLVIVAWEDHTASSEWKTERDVKESQPAICTTIGWLISEDRRSVKVCNSLIEACGTLGGESLILKKNIVSREYIEFV